MSRLELRRLNRLVSDFGQLRLLVVGDAMLDEYLWGDVDRVSPEAPVPVVHIQRESVALGGAANVVRNVVAMGAGCTLCAVVGEDPAGGRLIDLLKDLGVDASGIVKVEGRPTTLKTRVEARAQQIVRFDRETGAPLAAPTVRRLLAAIDEVLPTVQGAILEDYGKGVLSSRLVRAAIRRFRDAGVQVTVDPKDDLAPFRGADLVKPNFGEVERLAGFSIRSEADLERAATRLRKRLGGAALVVTRGADGMTVFEKDGPGTTCRSPAARSTTSRAPGIRPSRRSPWRGSPAASWLESVVIANAASAVVVGEGRDRHGIRRRDPRAAPAALAAAPSEPRGRSS